jgi:hypothetical protein
MKVGDTMQNRKLNRLTICVSAIAMLLWMSAAHLNGALASNNNEDEVVSGNVINSKYLAIT